jgi:argininosuccinate lyase
VRHGIDTGQTLEDLDAETLSGFHTLLAANPQAAQSVMTLQWSVNARRSEGGTAPEAVRAQWKQAQDRLKSWAQ